MKIKEGFVLRQVAGQNIVLSTGNELDMNMMITLNDTGAFLWEHLPFIFSDVCEASQTPYGRSAAVSGYGAIGGNTAGSPSGRHCIPGFPV